MPSDRLLAQPIHATASARHRPRLRQPLLGSEPSAEEYDGLGGGWLALGGALLGVMLSVAGWAAWQYHRSAQQVTPAPREDVALPVVVTAPPASRALPATPGQTAPGAVQRTPSFDNPPIFADNMPRFTRVTAAVAPLGWDELALMVRTGFTDAEVIQAIAGKQLTFSLSLEQERALRGTGAGNQLISYLRSQPVYNAPRSPGQATQTSNQTTPFTSARSVPQATPTPAPVVDYAARDRQVAALQKQIDRLDESIRRARVQPNHYNATWNGTYGVPAYNSGLVHQDWKDEHVKNLEEQRDELRREKWRLEGR